LLDVAFPEPCIVLSDLAGSAVRGGSGWLVFGPRGQTRINDECRYPGRLYVHRWARPVHVEVIIAMWSASRTELRLELRCERGALHIPTGYFDVAHSAVDRLREGIESRVGRSPAT
jgi:hypothetical protein